MDNIKWTSIKDDELVPFDHIGEEVTGKLLSKGVSEKFGVGIYEIETSEGIRKRIFGKTQLDRLMEQVTVGQIIRVIYIEDKETTSGTLKVFDIQIGNKV